MQPTVSSPVETDHEIHGINKGAKSGVVFFQLNTAHNHVLFTPMDGLESPGSRVPTTKIMADSTGLRCTQQIALSYIYTPFFALH